MSNERNEWARAFARQSASDFEIFQHLTAQPIFPSCHPLHYLQMACEKLAKAYRCRDESMPIADVQSSHIAFSKVVERIVMSPELRSRYIGKDAQLKEIKRYSRLFARDVERLAPAVDRDAAPQNAEYPWQDALRIIAPCDYSFQLLGQLNTPEGRNFLKLVTTSIKDFSVISGA